MAHIVGFAFVDDTDLIELDMRNQTITIEEVLTKMQQGIDQWEGGLKMTGGAIVPKKSWVYPIDFAFDRRGRWRYKTLQEIEFDFTVTDHTGERQPLKKVEPSQGQETLGVIMAPDGNHEDIIKELRKKAENWAELIETGHLNRDDVWRAMDSTIMASLKYPVQATTLTEENCKYIMAPVLKIALPRAAVCRNFPREVLYGPVEENGLGKCKLFTYQNTAQIELLVEHIGANTMTGDLLRCSIKAAKIEIGIGRNLFSLDFDIYGHLCTDSMVKAIWKFAHENNIYIEDNVTNNMTLQCKNDLFLMEQFSECGFSKADMKQINICRIYMQATTFADVTNGFGNKISDDIMDGTRNTEVSSPYLWPRQERPENEFFRLWRKALKLSFPRIEDSLKLQYTAGIWTVKNESWKWFYAPQAQALYNKIENGRWKLYKRQARRGQMGNNPRMKYH